MTSQLSATTRSSLIERVKQLDDDEGWREFARTYSNLVRRLAMKAGLSEHEADDILQEVLISVARHIQAFRYQPVESSFRHWLTTITRWRVIDQRRRLARHALLFGGRQSELDGTDQLERIPDPSAGNTETECDLDWGRTLVETALERVKQKLNAKDYQIYFLAVLRQTSVAEVCRRLNVNRGQVYLAKHRVGRAVEKELSRLKRKAESRA